MRTSMLDLDNLPGVWNSSWFVLFALEITLDGTWLQRSRPSSWPRESNILEARGPPCQAVSANWGWINRIRAPLSQRVLLQRIPKS